jgi:hypothetical protein
MAIRYGANGMPMAEKKVPKPVVVEEAPKPEPVVEQPKIVEEVVEENVNVLNDDVEEGNVSKDNE